MPIIGHIGALDPDAETFRPYESRIKQYFEANAIPDGRQRAARRATKLWSISSLRTILVCSQLLTCSPTLRNHCCRDLCNWLNASVCTSTRSRRLENGTDYIATLSLKCGYEAKFTLRDILRS